MSDQKEKLKVVIATPLYTPQIGGPASYTKFAETNLPEQGIEVTVCSFTTVTHLPKGIRHLAYLWQLLRAARHADIIFALDPVSVGVPAMLASRLSGRPLVLRIAGDYAWEAKQLAGNSGELPHEFTRKIDEQSPKLRFFHWLQSKVAGHACLIVTQTEYLRSAVAAWGVSAEKIQVIYTVLPQFSKTVDQANARQELGYAPGERIVVTAGRMIPLKRFDMVIKIFKDVLAAVPDAKLLIAGDGPKRETLAALVAELELDNHVSFTGVVSQPQLQKMFAAADLFVLNSTYETFPNIVLEAAGVGVSIIATDVGGNHELGTLGIAGLQLVTSGDETMLREKMTECLTQPQRHHNDPQSAALRRFDKEEVVGQLATLLRSVT